MTYQSTLVLHFENKVSANKAHAVTGWPHFDDDLPELTFHDDMLMVVPIGCDGSSSGTETTSAK